MLLTRVLNALVQLAIIKFLPVQADDGQWYLIEKAPIICPAVTPPTGQPALPPYTIGIDYSNIDRYKPYIFTILRTTDKAVAMKFKVTDANGTEVTSVDVTLGVISNTPPAGCMCKPENLSPAFQAKYGSDYGNACKAHDEAKCDTTYGVDVVGEWCCRPWCFVDESCSGAFRSDILPGAYFAYSACIDTTYKQGAACPWRKSQPCDCKSAYSLFSTDMKNKFPTDYGESCKAWDSKNCHVNYAQDQLSEVCCESWCYVDKACSSAKGTWNVDVAGTIFWSSEKCPDDPLLISQCDYKKTVEATPENKQLCACNGDTMPNDVRPTGAPANYGSACGPHNAEHCDTWFSGSQLGMWCCESWCWVDDSCPDGQESTIWPGHFYSKLNCDYDDAAVSSCKFSQDCACRNNAAEIASFRTSNPHFNFPSDYGTECQAWDNTSCAEMWNGTEWWANQSSTDWCCDSWCWVSEACPIAQPSDVSGLFFSYGACVDPPQEVYKASTDTCATSRLLSGLEQGGHDTEYDHLEELDEENTEEVNNRKDSTPYGRLLSSRRRGGSRRSGGSSSSWTSPRRRRTASAPSGSSHRRRGSSPSPPPPPPPPVRRRAPPRPVQTDARRRTQSLAGSPPSTPARRRAPPGTPTTGVGSPRRRVAYGYTSKPQLMNNYGGTVPQQTSYGYSGANAYQSGSRPNLLLAGGAGLAGGLLLGTAFSHYGAGSYYGYNSQYGGFNHRRRRTGPMTYCIAPPSAGQYAGQFMECSECYARYGSSACSQADSCYTGGGCGYTTQDSFNRDDILASGFIPADYQPPLSITFTSLSGEGISEQALCVPANESDNRPITFAADLFLTLTPQNVIDSSAGTGCETATGSPCQGGAKPGDFGTTACYGPREECFADLSCHCMPGYCLSGSGSSLTCVESVASVAGRVARTSSLSQLIAMLLVFRSSCMVLRERRQ